MITVGAKTYGLGAVIALLVLVACVVVWLTGALTPGLTLLFIALLALALLL